MLGGRPCSSFVLYAHRLCINYLGLVHTSDGIGSGVGIGSTRSVTIQCKSKIGIGSRVGSSTESESEGSEEFLFLPILLLLPSLPIQWEQGERNWNRKQNCQPIKKLTTSPFQTSALEEKLAEAVRQFPFGTLNKFVKHSQSLWSPIYKTDDIRKVELSVGRTKFSHKVPKFALTFPF